MKKTFVTSTALLAFLLALGTGSIAADAHAQTTKKPTKKPTVTAATIPPPICPPNEPNGCGIYD